jgi:hypothetical protein
MKPQMQWRHLQSLPFKDTDWEFQAKAILKSQLSRLGWTYRDLSQHFADMGINESEANLRNKFARGSFTAAFFLKCLAITNTQNIHLGLYFKEQKELWPEMEEYERRTSGVDTKE